MRITNKRVSFTKKEERVVFACYYEALLRVRTESMRANLDLVRRYFIEGDGDLTPKVWEFFLNNCSILAVPSLTTILDQFEERTDGKGSYFYIAKEETSSKQRARAMAMRNRWRHELREYYAERMPWMKDDYFDRGLRHESTLPTGFQVRSRKRTKPQLSVVEGGVR